MCIHLFVIFMHIQQSKNKYNLILLYGKVSILFSGIEGVFNAEQFGLLFLVSFFSGLFL